MIYSITMWRYFYKNNLFFVWLAKINLFPICFSARSTPTSDAWAAFSNDTQASSASNDIWSAAFADVKTDTAQGGDIWGSSVSSQQTAGS